MKPILFNTDMVRAIQNGTKTVTRRVVKPQPKGHAALLTTNLLPETIEAGAGAVYAFEDGTVTSPPYRPGDILYVREAWAAWSRTMGTPPALYYKADGNAPNGIKWHPSIHMPREAARLFLRVTAVRVERLQDITERQAKREGVIPAFEYNTPEGPVIVSDEDGYYILGFKGLWGSTIKPEDRTIYGWAANPWVWVIEFERCEKPEGA